MFHSFESRFFNPNKPTNSDFIPIKEASVFPHSKTFFHKNTCNLASIPTVQGSGFRNILVNVLF